MIAQGLGLILLGGELWPGLGPRPSTDHPGCLQVHGLLTYVG